jgi:hypothetical protein
MAFMTPIDKAPAVAVKDDPCDVFLWPDDSWCPREEWERGGMSHKSDDFIVIREDDKVWELMSDGEVPRYDDFVSRLHDRGNEETGAPRGAQHGAGASGQTPVETRPTGPVSTGRETARLRAVSHKAVGPQR